MKLLSHDEYAALDPGIRLVVTWLRDHGYNTTDSGDGVSKAELIAEGEALDEPHVFMTCPPATMVLEADRLYSLLERFGSGLDMSSRIEASYSPDDGIGVIGLFGVTSDSLIAATRPSSEGVK